MPVYKGVARGGTLSEIPPTFHPHPTPGIGPAEWYMENKKGGTWVEPRWSLGWNLNGVSCCYLFEKEEDTERKGGMWDLL